MRPSLTNCSAWAFVTRIRCIRTFVTPVCDDDEDDVDGETFNDVFPDLGDRVVFGDWFALTLSSLLVVFFTVIPLGILIMESAIDG